MDLNKRFLFVGEAYGLNRGEYAQKLSVSQGVISHIGSGRNKPGLEMVLTLFERFPEVDPEWLLLGKGEMKRQKTAIPEKEELLKLVNEIRLLNDMNYNTLSNRIESIEKRLKGQ
jgi:predicted transcriptional regulator